MVDCKLENLWGVSRATPEGKDRPSVLYLSIPHCA